MEEKRANEWNSFVQIIFSSFGVCCKWTGALAMLIRLTIQYEGIFVLQTFWDTALYMYAGNIAVSPWRAWRGRWGVTWLLSPVDAVPWRAHLARQRKKKGSWLAAFLFLGLASTIPVSSMSSLVCSSIIQPSSTAEIHVCSRARRERLWWRVSVALIWILGMFFPPYYFGDPSCWIGPVSASPRRQVPSGIEPLLKLIPPPRPKFQNLTITNILLPLQRLHLSRWRAAKSSFLSLSTCCAFRERYEGGLESVGSSLPVSLSHRPVMVASASWVLHRVLWSFQSDQHRLIVMISAGWEPSNRANDDQCRSQRTYWSWTMLVRSGRVITRTIFRIFTRPRSSSRWVAEWAPRRNRGSSGMRKSITSWSVTSCRSEMRSRCYC